MTDSLTTSDQRLDELRSALDDAGGDDCVVTDEARTSKYRVDRAEDPDAGWPLAVVRPTTTAQVQATLRWASEHGVSVVTRGAGSGLSGGSTAQDGAVVLSTERMRELHIDTDTRVAVVQPGLFNAEVKQAAAEQDLWYPPDPSSYEICSIGGNVATNAGGLCCVKYGVTSEYVLGLEVVLADGTAIRLGGARIKDSAGLSLLKLMVGSEGTLGVVTEATLRLLPRQSAPCTVVATFATNADATSAVVEIMSAMRPAMLEYMDRSSINAVEDSLKMGLDREAAAMLIAQTDLSGAAAEQELKTLVAACEKHGASEVMSTSDPDESEQFVHARRHAIPAVEKRGKLLLEDVGVPTPSLPKLVDGIERIAQDRELDIALIAHAGDGNTHPLIVFDPADEQMAANAEKAFGEIMDLAIGMGGTITGEHGTGRLKKPWLVDQVGPDVLALTERVKHAFDPAGILNPGVIV